MNNKSNFVIGMVHLPPLIGFDGYPGQDIVISHSLKNVHALIDGGIDAVLIENNYDLPHTKYLDPEIMAQMTYVLSVIRRTTTLPLGICCLRNDRRSALSIAKIVGLQFVRIPVFVDHIKTHYGFEIKENPSNIISFREKIGASDIKIYCDIQVKHCEILDKRPLQESARAALEAGADGLIVTGKWTGDFPRIEDLSAIKNMASDKPLIIGSGTSSENIKTGFQYVDGVIVGTSLKTNNGKEHEINIKEREELIDPEKVKKLMEASH